MRPERQSKIDRVYELLEQSWPSLTYDEIAQQVGVSKALVFRYADKQGLTRRGTWYKEQVQRYLAPFKVALPPNTHYKENPARAKAVRYTRACLRAGHDGSALRTIQKWKLTPSEIAGNVQVKDSRITPLRPPLRTRAEVANSIETVIEYR